VQQLDPGSVAPAAASYSLGIAVHQPALLVHTAGIVGTSPDGTVADDLSVQAAEIWRTIGAVLAEAGLGFRDVVSYTTYVVDGEDLSVVMAARDNALAGHRCASTLIVVPRLARPEWRMEIAAVAAK
jgi:2-iminobutanoate/2-iminopropanoate deaminase